MSRSAPTSSSMCSSTLTRIAESYGASWSIDPASASSTWTRGSPANFVRSSSTQRGERSVAVTWWLPDQALGHLAVARADLQDPRTEMRLGERQDPVGVPLRALEALEHGGELGVRVLEVRRRQVAVGRAVEPLADP